MCGPSSAETGLQQQSQGFSTQLMSNYSQLFSQQQGVLAGLNKSLSPIVAAGPNQQGFSGAELNSLNTSAINANAGATQSALQAARTFGAGQGGGGTSGLTSGITKQIESSVAAQGAGNLATNEGQIQQANWAQGNSNYFKALGAQEGVAQLYNPNGSMTGAINENNNSFSQASAIDTQDNAMAQDIAGFATAAVGSAGDIISAAK